MGIARQGYFTPAIAGVWTGLTGGVVYSFIDNAPLWMEGNILATAPARLLSLAYTTAIYALSMAIPLGVAGLPASAFLFLLRRPARPAPWPTAFTGLLTGTLATITWMQSHGLLESPAEQPHSRTAILLGCAAGLLLGALSGGLFYLAAARWFEKVPQRAFRRRLARWAAPVVVAGALLSLIGVGLYRNVLQPAFPPAPRHGAATVERPNIVLITVDSMRADHLGIYGYDPAISPHIDALARRGAYFTQAIAPSSWTMPSVAATITSLYPTELGLASCVYEEPSGRLDPQFVTMAEALQANGFLTQAFLTNVWLTAENGYTQGFDGFAAVRPPEPYDLEKLVERPLLKLFWSQPPLEKALWQSHRLLFEMRMIPWQSGLMVNEQARNFMRQHAQERFFLWLYYMEPHAPYNPYAAFPSLPAGITAEQEHFLRNLDYWTLAQHGTEIIGADTRPALLALYDGGIHTADAWIGEIVTELERLGLGERTLIVVHSDHGEEFLDHGRYTHGHTLCDELLRVPLVIAGPGIAPAGRAIATPVQLLDLLPTLLETAGASPPAAAHGRSLWPLLRGAELAEVPAYSEKLHTTCSEQKAVHYRGWKLIYDLGSSSAQLYNLQADPAERVNLAEQEPARREEYLRLLRRWLDEATRAAESMPRSTPPAPVDSRVRELLREGGY